MYTVVSPTNKVRNGQTIDSNMTQLCEIGKIPVYLLAITIIKITLYKE